jgi:hypothetical protein
MFMNDIQDDLDRSRGQRPGDFSQGAARLGLGMHNGGGWMNASRACRVRSKRWRAEISVVND